MELRVSEDYPGKRDIPSFIEPLPPLISNPFMRPRPEKRTNLMDLFEEDSECEEPELLQVYLRLKPCKVPSKLYEVRSDKCLITSLDTATAGHGRRTQHNVSKMYTFSRIFGVQASQKEIFESVVKDNLRKLAEGHSYTLLTYGASGSGKTYTLMGTVSQPGLVPRSLEYVFKVVEAAQKPIFKPSESGADRLNAVEQDYEVKWVRKLCQVSELLRDKYRRMSVQLANDISSNSSDWTNRTSYYVWVSFVEIYNEAIYDLLVASDRRTSSKLRIREDASGQVYVKGASQAFVRSAEEAYDVMVAGKLNLQVAATGVHAHSSRSHCIFTITMVAETEGGGVRTACVRLCDLAGAERALRTGNTGARMQESRAINSSLHVLERCLHMLRRRRKGSNIVPFRESKLTRILGAGLSGSRGEAVSMVVTLNPEPAYAHETRHVLQLAAVAKDIQINNTVAESTISSTLQDSTMASSTELYQLRAENERLQFELRQAETRNKELLGSMEERQQEVARKMTELVDDAKDMTRQFYESQIAQLKMKHQGELDELAEKVTPSQSSEDYQKLLTEITVLEEKLALEKLARERAEQELEHLRACIEEREQEKSPEVPVCEENNVIYLSDGERSDSEDELNESLEPSFMKERARKPVEAPTAIENDLKDDSITNDASDDSTFNTTAKETSIFDKSLENTSMRESCDTNSVACEKELTSSIVPEVNDDTKYSELNNVSDKIFQRRDTYILDTSDLNQSTSEDSGCSTSKNNDRESSESVSNGVNVSYDGKICGAISKSALHRLKTMTRETLASDASLNSFEQAEQDIMQKLDIEKTLKSTSDFDIQVPDVEETQKTKTVIETQKLNVEKSQPKIGLDFQKPNKTTEMPLSKSNTLKTKSFEQIKKELMQFQASIDRKTRNDVSLADFERIENDIKIIHPKPPAEDAKGPENKRTYFEYKNDDSNTSFKYNKTSEKEAYFGDDNNKSRNGEDENMSCRDLKSHFNHEKEVNKNHSLSKVKETPYNLKVEDIKMLKEKRTYFDDIIVDSELLKVSETTTDEVNNCNINPSYLRSPSIVEEEIPQNYGPTTIKKLLCDSFSSVANVTTTVNNKKLTLAQVSEDIFASSEPLVNKPLNILEDMKTKTDNTDSNDSIKVVERPNFDIMKSKEVMNKKEVSSDTLPADQSEISNNTEIDFEDIYKDITVPRSSVANVTTTVNNKKITLAQESEDIFASPEPLVNCIAKQVKILENIKTKTDNNDSIKVEERPNFNISKSKEVMNKKEVSSDTLPADQSELSNNTEIDFEDIYKDITVPRTTEFDLLVSRVASDVSACNEKESPPKVSEKIDPKPQNDSKEEDIVSACNETESSTKVSEKIEAKPENHSKEENTASACKRKISPPNVPEKIEAKPENDSKVQDIVSACNEKENPQRVAEETDAKPQSDSKQVDIKPIKYNLRHKSPEKPAVRIKESSEIDAKDKNAVQRKRTLRLKRRPNVVENDSQEENNKLRDIVNLQSEFSDVIAGIPAPQKIVKDIPSPVKNDDENEEPVLGAMSCPSKSVTRSRRKLFTPRAEPLEESPGHTGDSNERIRVPRPSYHKGRARRKL